MMTGLRRCKRGWEKWPLLAAVLWCGICGTAFGAAPIFLTLTDDLAPTERHGAAAIETRHS